MIAKSYVAYSLPCTDPKLTFQVLQSECRADK